MTATEIAEPRGPRVRLKVGGQMYAGWESATITRSLETLAGTFELSLNEKWEGQQRPWRVRQGDECSVEVQNSNGAPHPLITGFVDRKSTSLAGEDHTVSVSGRDRAGLLVDSSALLAKWEFNNVHPLQLVTQICQPHGIKVALQAGIIAASIALPKKYAIDPGDTGAAAIENICRVAGLLAVSDGLGGILLTRAGAERCATSLVEGRNVLRAEATYDSSGRFHRYVVLGSHKGRDDLSGPSAAGVKGEAIDSGVVRESRVLIIRPEGNVTPAQATQRAQWEAAVRAARATTVSVSVQGWLQGDGTPWPLNRIVRVVLPTLGLGLQSGGVELLTTRVTHTVTLDQGTTTQLELRSPEAFRPEIVQQAGSRNNLWNELRDGV